MWNPRDELTQRKSSKVVNQGPPLLRFNPFEDYQILCNVCAIGKRDADFETDS